ncbi:DUF2306 domain-containing protein [Arthrobacter sp. Br18]|uniref:DUF2306 domain-containing protein n=1 Tax=Arthrobacter sp. Br18 TaxID=1312954 RepID=UPI0004BAED53|nr:DUF2306 domain-containing protein [Arthrobacter sp. Br18]
MKSTRKPAAIAIDPPSIPRPRPRRKPPDTRWTRWFVPAGLIFLSLVPVIAGTIRLTQLAGGEITSENTRFFDSPIPVLIHIPTVTLYLLLGAFQFVPSLRRGKRGRYSWHRIAGRILVPTGLLAALSGLWMAIFYDLPPHDGPLLLVLRLVFGSAMVGSLILGYLAVRQRDYVRHSEWMARAYAIGIAQGTIVVVTIPWILLVGPADELTRALLIGASWVISLAVAEYFIYRRSLHAPRALRPSRRVPIRS